MTPESDLGVPAARAIIRDVSGGPLALIMFAVSGGELIGQVEIEPHVALMLAEELIAAARRRIVAAGVEAARAASCGDPESPARSAGIVAGLAFVAAAGAFGTLAGASGALAAAGVRALGFT